MSDVIVPRNFKLLDEVCDVLIILLHCHWLAMLTLSRLRTNSLNVFKECFVLAQACFELSLIKSV